MPSSAHKVLELTNLHDYIEDVTFHRVHIFMYSSIWDDVAGGSKPNRPDKQTSILYIQT